MMNMGGRSSRCPFTATQRQELEHQALVFKYINSGIPIPPDLLLTIRASFESSSSSSSSSNFLLHQLPQHQIGWNNFHLGMGFGRKVDPEPGRCRRTDGKKWRCSKEAYPDSKYCERHMHRGRNRSRKPVEISPIPKNTTSHSPTHENPTNYFFLESNAAKDYRSSYGNSRNLEDAWQMAQLTMGSSSSSSSSPSLSYYNSAVCVEEEEQQQQQPKKIMHHFLEPKENKLDYEDTTQLSISIPNALHDFFMTQKW